MDTGAGNAYVSKLSLVSLQPQSLGSSSATVAWTVPASQLDAIGNHSYVATIDITYSGLSKKRETIEIRGVAMKRTIPNGSQVDIKQKTKNKTKTKKN